MPNVRTLITLGVFGTSLACGGGPTTTDDELTAFFRKQIEVCNDWNVTVGNRPAGEKAFDGGSNDPSRSLAVVENKGDGTGLLQDADGNQLRVDVGAKTITAAAGPTEMLPTLYQFCPAEIFVGPSGD